MEEREVAQPLKASLMKLKSSFDDEHPCAGDQLKKQREKQLAGFFPVDLEERGREDGVKDDADDEENRTGENDIFEKGVDDEIKEKAEGIWKHSYKIRIEYGNYKGSGKHKMHILSGRMGDNDYKYGKGGRELEIKTSDDPAEFEEPELYESMRLLKEAEGSKVKFFNLDFFIFFLQGEEEVGRKRRGGGELGGLNANAKRPTLNLEKMLKV